MIGDLSQDYGGIKKSGKPWFVIDRGPPAYSGAHSRTAEFPMESVEDANSHATGGFVVSPTHEDYVRKIIGEEMKIAAVLRGEC